MTCYANAIIGSTAAHSLWYLNNDASFDVAHFAASFLHNYMGIDTRHPQGEAVRSEGKTASISSQMPTILPEGHCAAGNVKSISWQMLSHRKGSVFNACEASSTAVLIVKSTKLRERYLIRGGMSWVESEGARRSAWSVDDVKEVVMGVIRASESCVKVSMLDDDDCLTGYYFAL
jgi:hypothetical protein